MQYMDRASTVLRGEFEQNNTKAYTTQSPFKSDEIFSFNVMYIMKKRGNFF